MMPHLLRRFVASLSRRPPPAGDEAWVLRWLSRSEAQLWRSMAIPDRRHSIDVARRFQARRPDATPAEMSGALLHDVGKVRSGLGTIGRVFATVVGPRTERLRAYHDHEAIGAGMAHDAGSDPITVALITGGGEAAADLRAADNT